MCTIPEKGRQTPWIIVQYSVLRTKLGIYLGGKYGVHWFNLNIPWQFQDNLFVVGFKARISWLISVSIQFYLSDGFIYTTFSPA